MSAAAIAAGEDRACVDCLHHVVEFPVGRPVDVCSNRRVRWDSVSGQPFKGNAIASEARAPGGRCGEAGLLWEPKP